MDKGFSDGAEYAGAAGRLTIDLDALRGNYLALSAHVAPSIIAGVIKADAYGLGAARVAPVLEDAGCRHFFVAMLSEAMDIAPILAPDSRLYILNGLAPGMEAACADRGFVPVLNAGEQVRAWVALAAARGTRLPAILQVDTGMSRLGVPLEEAERLARDEGFAAAVDLCMVMTHFACADEPANPANLLQVERFERIGRLFPGVALSIANSAGALLEAARGFDYVRSGISLYGVRFAETGPDIRPVVRLTARVLQTRQIEAGVGVGYGLEHVAGGPMRIATLSVGYADGWPRSLGNRGAAWFAGQRLPILGRVSMDSMTVDIGATEEGRLAVGNEVELIGPDQPLSRVAADASTIEYEILTRLGRRYARTYVGGAGPEPAKGAVSR